MHRTTAHPTYRHAFTTRTLCALAAPLLLAAGCSPPSAVPRLGGGSATPEFPHTPRSESPVERADDVPSYDPSVQPKTAAIGSEDLVAWRGGKGLVASDPTTDSVYLVDLNTRALAHHVPFESGAEPGRVATTEDTAFVVLQGTGELARIDTQGQVTGRTNVCKSPRGVALDSERGRAWVACASSEVVSVDLDSFQVASTWFVDSDLRDIIQNDDRLYVSRFRTAEILTLNIDTGEVDDRVFLPAFGVSFDDGFFVGTLWRMKFDDDAIVTSYQRAMIEGPLFVDMAGIEDGEGSGYGAFGPCGAAVNSMTAIVALDPEDGTPKDVDASCSTGKPLPVDVERRPCGPSALSASTLLTTRDSSEGFEDFECQPEVQPEGNALAMERLDSGSLYVLGRGTDLTIRDQRGNDIVLAKDSPAHLGQVLFHGDAGSGIACASCHPSGGSDGRAWDFFIITKDHDFIEQTRRTQTLRAGIEGKLHWDGEFENMNELMSDVFSKRMGGFEIEQGDEASLVDWLGQLEPETGLTHPPELADVVARGAELFASTGCDGCHSGDDLTDHKFYDVGTGGMLKTPTLRGIAHRTTFLHDGCASTLRGRFDPECGGNQHGDVADLNDSDLDALTAYLETL